MLSLEDVTDILAQHKLPAAQIQAIVTDLTKVEEEKKEERVVGAKAKNMLIPIILDPEGRLNGVGDFAGLVVQAPEGAKASDIIPSLHKAAYAQENAAKRKKRTFANLVEFAEHHKRAFTKEQQLHIKTKILVPVIVTDGAIPRA